MEKVKVGYVAYTILRPAKDGKIEIMVGDSLIAVPHDQPMRETAAHFLQQQGKLDDNAVFVPVKHVIAEIELEDPKKEVPNWVKEHKKELDKARIEAHKKLITLLNLQIGEDNPISKDIEAKIAEIESGEFVPITGKLNA